MATPFDPQILAIHSYADEPVLPSARISIDFLRHRFQQNVFWSPENTEESSLFGGDAFKPASVLMPIVAREHELQVLLTQRAAHLHHHGGQISFPGGRVDATDTSPEHTALREAQEEIGQVVEAVSNTEEIQKIAAEKGIEMPIAEQLHKILIGQVR